MAKKKKDTKGAYAKAGVDIDAAKKAVDLMEQHIRSTYTKETLSNIGSFAGLLDVSFLKDYDNPVQVYSIDGVGTKMMVAEMMGIYSVGQCIVNHCVNDILVSGATPLTFLNYVGTANLKPEIIAKIVKQMAIACQQVGIPLIGGETAEMPGVYQKRRHDVVGCISGVVERERIINGSKIVEGDVLIGLPSSGLHTNGYSLARKAFLKTAGYKVYTYLNELECTVGKELLKIHRCYLKAVAPLLEPNIKLHVHGIAHITGGGLIDNIARLLPKGLFAEISYQWEIPSVFKLIQEIEKVSNKEMRRVFNLGIGMVLIAPFEDFNTIRDLALKNTNFKCRIIGEIKKTSSPLQGSKARSTKLSGKKNKVVFTY